MAQGIPVRVFDSKKGENTILLLHGYLETLTVWEDFVGELVKAGYRVISIDLPGHGLSGTHEEINTMELMSDVLNEILDKLNINRCFVTGHSMGGYVALAFSKKYSEKTKALCLFHSTPNPDSDEKRFNRDREIGFIKEGKLDMVINLSVPRMFANNNVKRFAEKIQEIEETATIAEPEGIIACLRGMKEREDMNLFLKEFDKPLLFIFGKKDNHISMEVVTSLTEKFPQAKTMILENSGHAGFIEEQEISVAGFTDFTKGVFV